MRKLYILCVIGLAALIIGLAWADQLTLTTYYPAPYGVYKEFTTTDKTCLATGAGTSVLIGTTTVPATNPKLHITGGMVEGEGFQAVETNGAYAFVERGTDNDGIVQLGGFTSATSSFVQTRIDGAPLILQLRSGGNVGIGRIPTANKLEVEGNASKSAAGDWLANSDISIKKDIGDIGNALEVINRLHPVKFRYTDEYKAEHPSIKDTYYYNFIAQEFQEVFPESVRDDGRGCLQMDAYNVKPYLVAAVQEMDQEINNLKAEIRKLKTQLNIGQ